MTTINHPPLPLGNVWFWFCQEPSICAICPTVRPVVGFRVSGDRRMIAALHHGFDDAAVGKIGRNLISAPISGRWGCSSGTRSNC
jgi:hypothetical protein